MLPGSVFQAMLLDQIAPAAATSHALFDCRVVTAFPELGEVHRNGFEVVPFFDVSLGCEGLVRRLDVFLIAVMRQ